MIIRLAEISSGLKEAMEGIDITDIPESEMLE